MIYGYLYGMGWDFEYPGFIFGYFWLFACCFLQILCV